MWKAWRKNAVSRWRKFQNNPSGRNVGDCSVRAVSVALDVSWEAAYALIAANGFQMNDVMSSNSVWGSVLRQHGFYRHAIPNTCPDCFTIEDFAIEHPRGVYVVGTGNHVVTVKDGEIWDSWDSSKEIPVYYWSMEE
jgi:hypothetical protein